MVIPIHLVLLFSEYLRMMQPHSHTAAPTYHPSAQFSQVYSITLYSITPYSITLYNAFLSILSVYSQYIAISQHTDSYYSVHVQTQITKS